MRLDGRRWAAHRFRLDQVRVEGPLTEEPYLPASSCGTRLLLEDSDKDLSDDPALLLRIDHRRKTRKEPFRCVMTQDLEAVFRLEPVQDFSRLILAKKPGV